MTGLKYFLSMMGWLAGYVWAATYFNTFIIEGPFYKLWYGLPLILTEVIIFLCGIGTLAYCMETKKGMKK